MLKKIFIYIIFTTLLSSAALGLEKTFTLENLNYTDDVALHGVSSVFIFYVPVGNYDGLHENYLNIGYRYTEIAGENTILSVYANGLPVSSFTLPEKKGMLRIPLPVSLIRKNDFLKIELTVKLDYNRCDLVNAGTENLWFLLSKESNVLLKFEEEDTLNSIYSFFSEINGFENYNFVYGEENIETLNLIASIGEYIGTLSKGLKKNIYVSPNPSEDSGTGNIFITEGSGIELGDSGKNIFIGKDDSRIFSTDFMKLINSATASITEVNPDEIKTDIISLGSLGLSDKPLEVVYSSQIGMDLPLGVFGGVPSNTFLNLHISSFDQMEDEKIYMSVFFNDYLIGKSELKNSAVDEVFSFNIPEGYFSAFNRLSFSFRQYNASCKSSYVKIYGNSNLTFSGKGEIGDFSISQFPSFTFGKTLYIISDTSMETASMLSKLSYLKGMSGGTDLFGRVVPAGEFSNDKMLESYDSIIGILKPEDIIKFDKSLRLDEGITIINADTGKKLFESIQNNEFILARSLKYESKPAFFVTGTESGLLETTSSEDLLELKKIPGNLAVLKNGRAISFSLGRQIIAVVASEKDSEENFWYRYRFIIVLCLVAIAIVLLVLSYRKTSSGR